MAQGLDRRDGAPEPDQLAQLKARAGPDAEIVMVAEQSGPLGAADPLFPGGHVAWFTLTLPGPGLYLAVARAPDGVVIGSVLQDAGGAIIEVGTMDGARSSCMVRSEIPAALRLGAVGFGGEGGETVQIPLYRAARRGA